MPLRLAGGRDRTCPHCGRPDDHLHLRQPPPAPAAPPVLTVPGPARRSRRPGVGQLALWNTTAWDTTAWDTRAWDTRAWDTRAWDTRAWDTRAAADR